MASDGDWYDIDEFLGETPGSWHVEVDGVELYAPKSQCEINSENPDEVPPNEIWIPDWLAKREELIDE